MSITWENSIAVETQQFSADPTVDKKVKDAVKGLQPYFQRLMRSLPTEEDKVLLSDFLLSCERQENITVGTKRMYLVNLAYFLKHFDYKKPFKAMTSADVSAALTSLRKDRSQDPDQHFVNTYNQRAMVISKFYKWLAFPDKTPGERRNKYQKRRCLKF
jgi:hypothetical protein